MMAFLSKKAKHLLYEQAKNIVLTNQALSKKMVKYHIDNKDKKSSRGNFIIQVGVVIFLAVILGIFAGYHIVASDIKTQSIYYNNIRYILLFSTIPVFIYLLYAIQLLIKEYFGLIDEEETYRILSSYVYNIVTSQQLYKKKSTTST